MLNGRTASRSGLEVAVCILGSMINRVGEGERQYFQNGFRDGLMAVNPVAPCSVSNVISHYIKKLMGYHKCTVNDKGTFVIELLLDHSSAAAKCSSWRREATVAQG
ncbi:Y+L Amino Acid Transporter 1 [Manis pentadactyla]|nr:Y+L Amino Acid Transporter 1 [Manis pentadactyla]